MPRISQYSKTSEPGSCRLPEAKTSITENSIEEVSAEMNKEGIYVHKIANAYQSGAHQETMIRAQLEKIVARKVPTPATLVGVGFQQLFNYGPWSNTSGLVFKPSTASVLSYKGILASTRLRCIPMVPVNNIEEYSKLISNEFNNKSPAPSSIHYNVSRALLESHKFNFQSIEIKPLKLREDVIFTREKCREIGLRGTLLYSNKMQSDSIIKDVSSKFLIAELATKIMPIDMWTQSDLLDYLENIEHPEKSYIDQLLAHAKLKINDFDGDEQIKCYLAKGNVMPSKRNHYINLAGMGNYGALPSNEFLLMPQPHDVLGVLANVDSVFGIDHAYDIARISNQFLEHSFGSKNYPAITYRLSHKIGHSVSLLPWQTYLLPWSSASLVEFAKRGTIMDANGIPCIPDHFQLIHSIAKDSALISLQKDDVERSPYRNGYDHEHRTTRSFISNLRSVKEDGKNLLQLLIEHRNDPASIDAAVMFALWKVPLDYSDYGSSTIDALSMARERHHPALEMLERISTLSVKECEQERQGYIKKKLDAILRTECNVAHYDLRSGYSESGAVGYIPELQTYRVIEGRRFPTHTRTPVTTGRHAYSKLLNDMAIIAGSRCDASGQIQIGLWGIAGERYHYSEQLNLGVIHDRGIVDDDGNISHTLSFINKMSGADSRMTLRTVGNEEFGPIKVGISWQSDQSIAKHDAAPSEQSFSPIGTVTRSVLDNFLSRLNQNQLINDLPLLLDEVDITQNGGRQGPDHVNQRRYVLDNLSYLHAWQSATTVATETGEIVRTAVGENDPAQSAQIEMRLAEQMQLLQGLFD